MKDLQFALIVLGAGSILGVLVHGLWTIRKNAEDNDYDVDQADSHKYQDEMSFNATDDGYEEDYSSDDIDEASSVDSSRESVTDQGEQTLDSLTTEADVDDSNSVKVDVDTTPEAQDGVLNENRQPDSSSEIENTPSDEISVAQDTDEAFDEFGIGRIRTVDSSQVAPAEVVEHSHKSVVHTPTIASLPVPPSSFLKSQESSDVPQSEVVVEEAQKADDNISGPKTETKEFGQSNKAPAPDKATKKRGSSRSRVTEDQLSIDFDDVAEQDADRNVKSNKHTVEPEILTIHVRTSEDKPIEGARLLPLLLTLGCKFGEHQIFHRNENTDGTGPVLFSLANMFMPGVFDVDNMEQFKSQGVALFMMMPVDGDERQVFNMMHNAARKIADEFDGQILDGQRSTLTKHGVQRYYDRIKEFKRKQRLVR